MIRRTLIFTAIFAALGWSSACTRPPVSGESLLPPQVGAWTRTSLHSVPPSQANVLRAFEAVYSGAGKLTVDVYETKASGVAFEMTQHWRSSGNTVFFDKGTYFAVVKWDQADRAALREFVRALEKDLEGRTR